VSEGSERKQLLRDLVALQIKLFLDGLRDLLLSPVALLAGLLGLVVGRPPATRLFYDVIRFGRRTERWIDPFSAGGSMEGEQERGLDEVLGKIQGQLADQYKRGGISAAARDAVEQLLTSVRRGPPPPS
jgi:hypothetical protein